MNTDSVPYNAAAGAAVGFSLVLAHYWQASWPWPVSLLPLVTIGGFLLLWRRVEDGL